MLKWLRGSRDRSGKMHASGEQLGYHAGRAGYRGPLPSVDGGCDRDELRAQFAFRTGFAIGWCKGLTESSLAKNYVYQGATAEGGR